MKHELFDGRVADESGREKKELRYMSSNPD